MKILMTNMRLVMMAEGPEGSSRAVEVFIVATGIFLLPVSVLSKTLAVIYILHGVVL